MLPKTSALDVNCKAYDADVAMLVKIHRRPIRRDDTAGQRQVTPPICEAGLGGICAKATSSLKRISRRIR
jgi:hypothetical protein